MAKDRRLDEEEALRLLKEQGYIIKKPTAFRKRTFEVDEEVYHAFRTIQESLGLKVKEAFNMALKDWVTKHGYRGSNDRR